MSFETPDAQICNCSELVLANKGFGSLSFAANPFRAPFAPGVVTRHSVLKARRGP
jgi:hypothetical protein